VTQLSVKANEKRLQVQATAASMGIDEDYISLLVDRFYDRIKTHAELGPIFDARMGDHWDEHLATMKIFWSSVILNSGTYSGKPVVIHQQLENIEEQHFHTWLALFRETLEETTPSTKAIAHFEERAQRIAKSFQIAMFDQAR
jgi:hemoglobin